MSLLHFLNIILCVKLKYSTSWYIVIIWYTVYLTKTCPLYLVIAMKTSHSSGLGLDHSLAWPDPLHTGAYRLEIISAAL